MTVILGIDLGARRIGLAVGDTHTGSVRPLLTLRRNSPAQDASSIGRVCEERRVDAIVVGLPLNLDGSDSVQTATTRAWVADLERAMDRPVGLRDERRTSVLAESRLGHAPRGRSGGPPSPKARKAWRARIDREAAAEIVQRELDARAVTEARR